MSLLRLACAAAVLLAMAACGSDTPTPTAPGPDASGPSAPQRIVFVGPRFDVWTVQDDGSEPTHVIGGRASGPSRGSGGSGADVSHRQQAQNVGYTWPTWSPDGNSVALSRIPGREDAVASLVLLDSDNPDEQQLHTTQAGSVGLVAAGAPHYALWAPDSRLLSFVAPRAPGRGLGLFSVEPAVNGAAYEITAPAPLYHVWSPDGRYILVHRREQLLLHDTHDRSTHDLDASSFRYRVPSFSPDGERIAYVVDEGGDGRLFTSDLDGAARMPVMHVPGVAAFGYAPNDARLAIVTRPLSKPSYDELYVVDGDGAGADEPLVRGSLAAFYWSPDGSRLAYVTLDDSFAWHVLDPATGNTRQLTRFIPAPDFLTHIQFFDQFAPSHLLWSADSTRLVFAGVLDSSETPGVWVVDAVGDDAPRRIGDARLAFWVPSAVE